MHAQETLMTCFALILTNNRIFQFILQNTTSICYEISCKINLGLLVNRLQTLTEKSNLLKLGVIQLIMPRLRYTDLFSTLVRFNILPGRKTS